MNNHKPWQTNERERRLNIEYGLKTQRIIVWVLIAVAILACGLGAYFGFFAAYRLYAVGV